MKHIIILSGHSNRFLQEGYPIKPLIEIIDSKKIIDYVVETVKPLKGEDITFIIKKEDIEKYHIDKYLKNAYKGCFIKPIDSHYLGPVYSVLQANIDIPREEEVLVTYCDLYIKWDVAKFYQFLDVNKPDGCIVTHVGEHPHRLYNKSFAFLRVDENKVLEVKEKQYFTTDPIQEFASGGIYYFKTIEIMLNYFRMLIAMNITVDNEYYVTLPYNLMIKDGLNILHYDSKNYVCLGTPKDVEIFKSVVILQKHLNKLEDIKYCIDYFMS